MAIHRFRADRTRTEGPPSTRFIYPQGIVRTVTRHVLPAARGGVVLGVSFALVGLLSTCAAPAVAGAFATPALLPVALSQAPAATHQDASRPSASTSDYTVGFQEAGLPSGTEWSATVRGNTSVTLAQIALSPEPWTETYDSANGMIYVVMFGSNQVNVLNPATHAVVGTLDVGQSPRRALADPANGLVFVSDTLSNQISEINDTTNTVVGNLSVGSSPIGLALDPVHNRLFVDDSNDYGNGTPAGAILVLNATTHAHLATIPVGNDSRQVFYDTANSLLYASNYGDGTVWVINTTSYSVAAVLTVGPSPLWMMVDPVSSDILVILNVGGANNGAVVSSGTPQVLSDFSIGDGPGLGVYDPSNGWFYIPDEFSDSVLALNATTLAPEGNLSLGSYPVQAVYDPGTRNVFITNGYSNNVTVVPGATPSFPTGTPVGPDTRVDTVAGSFGGIAFSLPNGTYQVVFDPVTGYVALPETTNISVLGANLTLPPVHYYSINQPPSPPPPSSGWPAFLSSPAVLLAGVLGLGASVGLAVGVLIGGSMRPRPPPPGSPPY